MVPGLKEIDAEEATVLDTLGVEVLYRVRNWGEGSLKEWNTPNFKLTPLEANNSYHDYTFYVRN